MNKFLTNRTKSTLDFLRNECVSFGQFLKTNRFIAIFILMVITIIYGIKVFNISYSMDSELMMTNYGGFLRQWLSQDRYALVFIKRLLFPDIFNPHLSNILTYITLFVFCILVCYLIARARNRTNIPDTALLIVPIFLLVSPNLAEQFNFVLQSFEVAVGMVVTIVALLLFLYYLETNKKSFLVMSLPLIVYSIMTYQSLLLFYAAGAVMLLIIFITWRKNDLRQNSIKALGMIAATAAISLILYYLAVRGYSSYRNIPIISDYLSGQIPWGRLPLSYIFNNTYNSICVVVFGQSNFYNPSFLTAALGVLLCLLYRLFAKRLNIFGELICFAILFVIPFLMTILLGGNEAARSRMPTLQIVIGFSFYYIYHFTKNYLIRIAVISTVVIFGVTQAVTTCNLLYSEQIKFQSDVATANRIVSQLDGQLARPYGNYTLVLAGNTYHPPLPNFDSKGEMLGRSFFEFDQTSPALWLTSYRAANFMQTLGYDFKASDSTQQMSWVKTISQLHNMSVWPQRGSVYVDEGDGMIIVKMSEYSN
jgi:hypothetical protein